jgi:predicted transcriptional regulator YdeE
MLSDYLNTYKLKKPNEFLTIPKPLERGKVTAKDLIKATTADECVELIKKWVDEVYNSWSSSHSIVSQIADGFLDNNYNGKTQGRKTTNR